jgi:hypothetical protein
MYVRFRVSPATDEPHIYDHEVSESEVLEILRTSTHRGPAREGARQAVGQTRAGQYLKVVYLEDRDGIFVLTAYDLRDKGAQGVPAPAPPSTAQSLMKKRKRDPNQYRRAGTASSWNG